MKRIYKASLLFLLFVSNKSIGQIAVKGDLKKWHTIILEIKGPQTNELAEPNPFTYYRMDVTFTHQDGYPVLVVPGYYAADGNAANSSAHTGDIWKVKFCPPKTGNWKYEVSFKAGEMIAVKEGGIRAGFSDGSTGELNINDSDKKLPDLRARGRLNYIGKRYLQWAETGENFIKIGADSPENALHYEDFDGTLDANRKLDLVEDYKHLLKSWEPHARDFEPAASAFTWQNGKGKNILGMINYLSGIGVNAFSFLTFSADGDDGFVYPYLCKNDSLFLANHKANKTWERALLHHRFDVSKMEQWENVFTYAETKGMFLHFKTFENENVSLMGAHDLSDERKLYYRELIARFGHHLALNWNLSEETNVDLAVIKKTAAYIRQVDPYQNHIVQHTFPKGHKDEIGKPPGYEYYHQNLLGFQSDLSGLSMQLHKKDIHQEIKRWVLASEKSGKPWAIANDEQGEASDGVTVDSNFAGYTGKMMKDNLHEVRQDVLWATLMAGGYGVEYYYGYKTELSDLTAQDHRSRENKYREAVIAKKFFEKYNLNEFEPADEITADPDDYVLASEKQILIYKPIRAKSDQNVWPPGKWLIQYFDPQTGKYFDSNKKDSKQLKSLQDRLIILNRK